MTGATTAGGGKAVIQHGGVGQGNRAALPAGTPVPMLLTAPRVT